MTESTLRNIKFDIPTALKEALMPKPCSFSRALDVILRKKTERRADRKLFLKRTITTKLRLQHGVRSSFTRTNGGKRMTVLDMLTKKKQKIYEQGHREQHSESVTRVGDEAAYIKQVLKEMSRHALQREPWVLKPNPAASAIVINDQRNLSGAPELSAEELWNLCSRPDIFLWDPIAIAPSISISCIGCGARATRSDWSRPRMLYRLCGHAIYVARRYICYSCAGPNKVANAGKRSKYSFASDDPAVLNALPTSVKLLWRFADSGRHLCDSPLVDLVRAMATRSSWSAISAAISEMRARSWRRCVDEAYHALCDEFHVTPKTESIAVPNKFHITCAVVKNVYMTDFRLREDNMDRDFEKFVGDDILRVDWTHSAAIRCGGTHLLNIMDGNNNILLSKFSCNSKPYASRPFMEELFRRGARPKVVYVDEECCGGWPSVLREFWPDIAVRLDPMHAMMRLTRTTASTQHSHHGTFCASLTACIFQDNPKVLRRVCTAWSRERGTCGLPSSVKRKCVPRIIAEPHAIVAAVESLLDELHKKSYGCEGPLLTTATGVAWQALRTHILKGCLGDPPGITLNIEEGTVIIGGTLFNSIRSLRGTSPVEGLHAHQKQWLGAFAQHERCVGEALLKDGAWHWNRKKQKAMRTWNCKKDAYA